MLILINHLFFDISEKHYGLAIIPLCAFFLLSSAYWYIQHRTLRDQEKVKRKNNEVKRDYTHLEDNIDTSKILLRKELMLLEERNQVLSEN